MQRKIQKRKQNSKCKKIYGGYAIEEKDLTKIKKLKEKLQKTNKELLKQGQVLKAQKKLIEIEDKVGAYKEICRLKGKLNGNIQQFE